MKKILTLFLLAAFFGAKSQTNSIALFHHETTVSIVPNATIHVATLPGPDTAFKKTIDIQNTSPTFSNSYSVKRYDVIIHSVSIDDYAIPNFCFAATCFASATLLAPFPLELQPLENSADLGADTAFYSLDADLIDATVTGYSVVKYTVFNLNNVNDSIQFTMVYNTALKEAGISINNLSPSDLKIYPNPVTSNAHIMFNAIQTGDANITLVNTIGQVVYQTNTSLGTGENTIILDTKAYPVGVYYVALITPTGTVTKKVAIVK